MDRRGGVKVLYRKADGRGTRLYAWVPTLPMAVQQFQHAVKFAARAGYTLIWIEGHEGEHLWTAQSDR